MAAFSQPLNPLAPALPSVNTTLSPPLPNSPTTLSQWPLIPFNQYVAQTLHLPIHFVSHHPITDLAQQNRILRDISAINDDVDSGAIPIDPRDRSWHFKKALVNINLFQNLPLPRGQTLLEKEQVSEILHTVWALIYLSGARAFAARIYDGDVTVGSLDMEIFPAG